VGIIPDRATNQSKNTPLPFTCTYLPRKLRIYENHGTEVSVYR
jgi:hypothetical protein